MFEALDRKIAQWNSDDKEKKYKKFYEEQAAARLKELKEHPESVKEWDVTPTQ